MASAISHQHWSVLSSKTSAPQQHRGSAPSSAPGSEHHLALSNDVCRVLKFLKVFGAIPSAKYRKWEFQVFFFAVVLMLFERFLMMCLICCFSRLHLNTVRSVCKPSWIFSCILSCLGLWLGLWLGSGLWLGLGLPVGVQVDQIRDRVGSDGLDG